MPVGDTNVPQGMGVPHPARGLFPPQLEKYMFALVNAINELLRKHVIAINNLGDTNTFGIGVELRQIASGPMRDVTGRILDAGVLPITAPNQAQLLLAAPRVFQDLNFNVHFTGNLVQAIASPALVPFGIASVSVEVGAHIVTQSLNGFTANVTWTALDVATACDRPMHLAMPPQGTMWHNYAAMAAAYGFAAPYNALATAAGLNSIQYTVVDR